MPLAINVCLFNPNVKLRDGLICRTLLFKTSANHNAPPPTYCRLQRRHSKILRVFRYPRMSLRFAFWTWSAMDMAHDLHKQWTCNKEDGKIDGAVIDDSSDWTAINFELTSFYKLLKTKDDFQLLLWTIVSSRHVLNIQCTLGILPHSSDPSTFREIIKYENTKAVPL